MEGEEEEESGDAKRLSFPSPHLLFWRLYLRRRRLPSSPN